MSHVESQSGSNKPSQDFELNLAPIIDCMVVLIAFLMVSLSYLSIQMMDAGLNSPGGLASSVKSGISLEIKILDQENVELEVLKGNQTLNKTKHKLETFDQELKVISTKFEAKPETALISAQNEVTYDLVIKTMDILKGHATQVQLSGF